MKDGSPFGLAGLWENWRNPNTGEWERTFVIITVPSNKLVAQSTTACLRSWNLQGMTAGLVFSLIRTISSSVIRLRQ